VARLSRHRPPHLRAFAAALALAAGGATGRAAGPEARLDLGGTWHLLIHYRDAASPHPEREHWEDRLWEFELEGERLRWTEFPIVLFDDENGRFERSRGGLRRVLGPWRPSAAQLANLRAGLAVKDVGSQSKLLRPEGGAFISATRSAASSAASVGYRQIWRIDDPGGLPIFSQSDRLESEGVEGVEGRTELRTREVREGGRLLVGSFARDGTRSGSFELRRAGPRRR
jgi:hypothetical protein